MPTLDRSALYVSWQAVSPGLQSRTSVERVSTETLMTFVRSGWPRVVLMPGKVVVVSASIAVVGITASIVTVGPDGCDGPGLVVDVAFAGRRA